MALIYMRSEEMENNQSKNSNTNSNGSPRDRYDLMTDLHTKYTYDTLNRLTSITSSSPEALGAILYPDYDKLGNRKEENNQLVPDHNFHFTYNYNERYELTEVLDPGPLTLFSYQYDLTGNREQSTENGNLITYIPNNLNQYSSVNGQSYSYDAKGNLTNDGNCTYSYDYENRLISAACGVQPAATYQYDPFGRRITKTIASSETGARHQKRGQGKVIIIKKLKYGQTYTFSNHF